MRRFARPSGRFAFLRTLESFSARGYDLAVGRARDEQRLGRYIVLEQLGQGGMGVVHRAFDPALQREVALKRVRLGDSDASAHELHARLLREAQTMARLSHPNVVPVFDVAVDHGDVVIAMELVEGRTLREHLRANRPPWPEVVALFIESITA